MQNQNVSARVLFLDIETAPNLGWVWGKWEQNVIDFKEHWYMLSFSMKWMGERSIHTYSLPDFRGYSAHKENDEKLVRKLWEILDEADIVIAHNGDRFDIRKTNARFVFHGLRPPSPYKTIDTLKIAKKHFAFNTNKLDDLGHYLGVGRKLPTTGARLWLGCMRGDPDAWSRMGKYNAQDIALLERVYLRLRPWSSSHPDLGAYSRRTCCPHCESQKLHARGYYVTRTGRKQQFHCQDCGAWSSSLKFERIARS